MLTDINLPFTNLLWLHRKDFRQHGDGSFFVSVVMVMADAALEVLDCN
jgi:ligand-binding SRPBCC domain-containing protein